ncbi:MAG TPA: helix-turn-helix domain-containing protein [Anaerovoracaceae bacterium]|nr:helix-turn-helix domain-containing protein [Anaerovoracaceae bacterium]
MIESAKDILQKHTIVVLNNSLKHGFTQLPNYVLRDKKLSFGARLTYAVLLSYAWQEESCFPGQVKMSADLGVSRQMMTNYLNELRNAKYIKWERRGLGKTNIYTILDYQPLSIDADVNSDLHPDVKQTTHPDGKSGIHKYKQGIRSRRKETVLEKF